MTFLIAFSRLPEAHAKGFAHLQASNGSKIALDTLGDHVAIAWQPQFCSMATVVMDGYRFVGFGRCRLDRKSLLFGHLRRQGSNVPADASDLHLATLAYTVFGDAAVNYLHGDFAVAIWQEEADKIFLVRDRLGVHNLAYLKTPERTWISNSVDALTAVPDLDSSQLDAVWIANFLGKNTPDSASRSVFTQLRRLPPAHQAIVSHAEIVVERYWSLDPQTPLYLKNANDYLDRFHELLAQSITDRSPAGSLGISLSGGLDSATLAAKAVETTGSPTAVCADTWVLYGDADPEFQASKNVASFLGINHHTTEASGLHFDPEWQSRFRFTGEPSWAVLYPRARTEALTRMAHTADVWFYGEGPDNALTFEWQAYLEWLVGNHNWLRTTSAIADYLRAKSFTDWGQTVRSFSRRIRGAQQPRPDFDWIKAPSQHASQQLGRSFRPKALKNFNSGIWASFLEDFERDEFLTGITWRHPYLETELLEFMLRTPPIPWGRDKALIRRAMRGRVPDETVRRKKCPLYMDIYGPELGAKLSVDALPNRGLIAEYVDLSRLPANPESGDETEAVLRVLILDRWLQALAESRRT